MIKGFIFTGHRKQYNYYIRNNNLNPGEYPMLKNIEQLWGIHNTIIIKVGTYYTNPLHLKVCEWEEINNI